MKGQAKILLRMYLGEILLTGLASLILYRVAGRAAINDFVISTSEQTRYLFGLFMTGALSVCILLFNWTGDEFGDFLEAIGAVRILYSAFITAFFVFMFATVSCLFLSYSKNPKHVLPVLLVSVLGLLNAVTMIVNLVQLSLFRLRFRASKRAQR